MLKLAEHIVESKAAEFDPSELVDHYEFAVVEMLKQKQAGKTYTQGSGANACAEGRQRHRPSEA